MPLTPNQEKAVLCAGRPLFIQAGAGTGKTFTLTKRLAYQLNEESGPMLESVDNVLTITFTKKAAAELLGRVRAELRAEGMEDAALRIDAAWISTIHGMCSSILSANALQTGIDPGMTLLTQEESDELLQEALEDNLDTSEMRELSEFFGVQDACELVKKAAALLELSLAGVSDFDLGPAPDKEPYSLLRSLLVRLDSIRGALEAAGVLDKPTKTKVDCMAKIQHALERVEAACSQEGMGWLDALRMLETLDIPKSGNTGADFKELFQDAKETMLDAFAAVASAVAYQNLNIALRVAERVAARHHELKQKRGVQDTNDLLIGAFRLLKDNPSIAQAYRERFGSVMVDEFQDTDILQVGIVECLCDEQLSTLTTVGDAQQSIYGFRGADLETYRAMRSRMRDCDSLELKLDTNYRSHPDILAFVESIFGKPSFFGEEFLKIGAGKANVRSQPYLDVGEPRVKLLLAAGLKEGGKTASVDALRAAEAELIAEQFASLAGKGASYGDMALLMSSTKNAGVYLTALREHGIPCAVSGGSDFYLQPELGYLTALLRVLELPDDDQALLELLASPIFDVTDTELLALRIVARRTLGNTAPYDMRPKATLWDALCYQVSHAFYVENNCSISAHRVLNEALGNIGKLPLKIIVERVLEESGWLEELCGQGARGLAVAANAQRFCDLLGDFEKAHGSNAVLAAEHFRAMREGALEGDGVKATPGKMIGLGNDAVRIMTIHASKGLEFPIVAVAQYTRKSHVSTGTDLMTLTQDGERHIALPASFEDTSKNAMMRARAGELALELDAFHNARDCASFNSYANNLGVEREDEETQRLLYVALTRARDLLLLASSDKKLLSAGELEKGLFCDVSGAIFPTGFPSKGGRFKLDTGCLVECVVRPVSPMQCAENDELTSDKPNEGEDVAFRGLRVHAIPPKIKRASLEHWLSKKSRSIKSYTAIAAASDENASAEEDDIVSAHGGGKLEYAPALKNGEDSSGTVSAFGSAFHTVAQWLVFAERSNKTTTLEETLEARLAAVARGYSLDEDESLRLAAAIDAWRGSETYKDVMARARVYPEYAFCCDIEGRPVEGFIDLLCFDDAGQVAMIVDYKTGTSGEEDELKERYRLQGAVYSYAILAAELAQEVEVLFIRPEVDMQEIKYAYNSCDLESLVALITGE